MTYAVWRFQRVAALCTAAAVRTDDCRPPACAMKAPAPAAPAPRLPLLRPLRPPRMPARRQEVHAVGQALREDHDQSLSLRKACRPPQRTPSPRPRRRSSARPCSRRSRATPARSSSPSGLQEIEGAPKQALAVMVPLGVVIPGGVSSQSIARTSGRRPPRTRRSELKDLKTVDLKFSHCLPIGCTAETEATKRAHRLLKGNAGMAVLAIWTNGRQFHGSRCHSTASAMR